MGHIGIPAGAAIAINDMLEHCAKIQPGQEVLILAYLDGLYAGDNLVDKEAMEWLQTAIRLRGANPSILWVDEPARPNAWRFPPIVKAAMSASDIMINNTLDLSFEELVDFKQFTWDEKKPFVRNFATTSGLLNSKWAQTPYELVSEIRYQAALLIKEELDWQLTNDNGTFLTGKIAPAYHPNHPWFTSYAARREEAGYYRPWPEWVVPPIRLTDTSGLLVFDRMLSWWSRYIGISPYFKKMIQIKIENNRIINIEGGDEADSLRRFLNDMKQKLGEGVYDFNALHFGVHPQASISHQQCPNILYHRIIDHSHSSNIHAHIGAPEAIPKSYPYWVHITGDIRKATFKIGDTLVHDQGYLTTLDHPTVRAIAAKYPGRPRLEPVPQYNS